VADQIRLWQMERDRLQKAPGFLYEDFSSLNEFQVLKQYAEDSGILLYANPGIGHGVLVITQEGHEKMKEYLRNQR